MRGDSTRAFAAKGQPPMVEKGTCKICGRYGHEEAVCYEVIGYPPGWGTVAEDDKIVAAEAAGGAELIAAEDRTQKLQQPCIMKSRCMRTFLV